jgi:hypothetical protein
MNVPRFIRMRDAPAYLGMDRTVFNQEVRPNLTETPIGVQGIAFDRLDLDAWADHHQQCNGRPPRGDRVWPESNECPASGNGRTATSKLTNVSKALALCAKVQERKTTYRR